MVEDLEMQDFIATRLFTDQGDVIPITSLYACSDAVILKKEQPYPIGQRIPAHILSLLTDKADAVVTRPLLKTAIQRKALVKLTLSLPPFHLELNENKRRFL